MKTDVKTTLLAFFYNKPPPIHQFIDEFNISNKSKLGLDISQIASIHVTCNGIFDQISLPLEPKKNAKELTSLKNNITSNITGTLNYNLENNTLEKKIKKFKNFWDFTNFIANILCLPISKILEILYCNIKFQKYEHKFDLKKNTLKCLKPTYESFYSKPINLSPEITIENKAAHTFALKVKKAFTFLICLVAILAFPILIALGIVLKLIAQKKDPSIKKDYDRLKAFFTPQDITLGSKNSYIQDSGKLENEFKDKNLKNKIINKLTINADRNSKTFNISNSLNCGVVTNIKNLFLKTLVLNLNGYLSIDQIHTYKFRNFKRLPIHVEIFKATHVSDPSITFIKT